MSKHNRPSAAQIQAALLVGAFWTNSVDWGFNQCRTLIMTNRLTDRLGHAREDLPVHQVCEIRSPSGVRII